MRRVLVVLSLTACSSHPASTAAPGPTTGPTASARAGSPGDESICRAATVPDTPAGRRLEHLRHAMVATDRSLRERFVDDEMSEQFLSAIPRERHLAVLDSLHNDGRPILVCRIESTSDEEIIAILGGVDEHGKVEYGRFFVRIGGPESKVASLWIEPAAKEDLTRNIEPLDAEGVRRVVGDVAKGLEAYVYADKAAKMQARLREALTGGEYSGITDQRRLAQRLTEDLVAVTGDKHLRVTYSASVLPPPRPQREMTPDEIEEFKKQAVGDNFGMPVAEIRERNVGYLEVLAFLPPEVAAVAVAETMSKVADADALVIDLRQNRGGSPHGVALMTSYLFGKKPVHLNDIFYRSEDRTESFHTAPDAPGKHFGAKKPVFVLTSGQTFSAGEEFAYNLKAHKRATIVGEVTGGGAHPTEFVRVADHWGVGLPSARAINPITKTNWEGVGVKPDIEVPAEQALEKALELAAKHKK